MELNRTAIESVISQHISKMNDYQLVEAFRKATGRNVKKGYDEGKKIWHLCGSVLQDR